MIEQWCLTGYRYDMQNLHRFTLTVRKNYRKVPYHNWTHAFSVAHAVYTIIKTTHNKFTHIEVGYPLYPATTTVVMYSHSDVQRCNVTKSKYFVTLLK